jgi:hypothetical protein
MGSRLHIKLIDVLNHPLLSVQLSASELVEPDLEDGEPVPPILETHAIVQSGGTSPELFGFDYETYRGEVTLSKDWNYFRDEGHHKALLRWLFEHSIPFTVIH